MSSLRDRIRIELSADRMEARVSVTGAFPSSRPRFKELAAYLEASGVRYGTDAVALELFWNSWRRDEKPQDVVVAIGTPPVFGQPRKILRLPPPPRTGARALELLPLFVKESEAVFEIVDGTLGQSGRDVTDHPVPVPADPTAATLTAGAGIRVDGGKWFAARDGFLAEIDGAIEVSETLLHNYDLPSGDYQWHGDARISGDIRSGVALDIGGALRITGNVEDGVKISCGGNLVVEQCVRGSGTILNGHSSITVGKIDGATILAEQDVEIRQGAVLASICTHGRLLADSAGCRLSGSRIEALAGARIESIERHATQRTTISVGITGWLDEEHRALEEEIRRWEHYYSKLYEDFAAEFRELLSDRALIHRITADSRGRFELAQAKVLSEQARIDRRISEIRSLQSEMQKRRQRDESATISIAGVVDAECKLSIRGKTYAAPERIRPNTTLCVLPPAGRIHAVPRAIFESSEMSVK
ncbi:MAG: FapA family protein [Planctomycetota bacterium]